MKFLQILLSLLLLTIPTTFAAPLMLDAHPDPLAAYSLRLLSSTYEGPAIRVQRVSDQQEMDIGFTDQGELNRQQLLEFIGSSDGEVIAWYSQLANHPPLTPQGSMRGPLIVEEGQVVVDEMNLPRLKFSEADGLRVADPGLPSELEDTDITLHMVVESVVGPKGYVFQIIEHGWQRHSFTVSFESGTHYWFSVPGGGYGDNMRNRVTTERTIATFATSTKSAQQYQNHEQTVSSDVTPETTTSNYFTIGTRGRDYQGNWQGYVSEVLLYPYIADAKQVQAQTDTINAYWRTGPENYHADTLFPQKDQYQIDLYDWLESITIEDVTLPAGDLQWDGHYESVDQLANLWLAFAPHKASDLTRVTLGEPKWYVLDDGNDEGIEATGTIRIIHKPENAGNKKSWGNEPAYWYTLNIPMADGSNGNPYYQHPALANRALVVTAVDLLRYDQELDTGSSLTWNDMHGKALLSWVQAVYLTQDVLDEKTLRAFEGGFERNLDLSIKTGIRDANTNMDMFPVQATGWIAKYSTNEVLQEKAMQTAKRLLLGYADGELYTRHDVNEGAFFPAGYVGENDMAETFYNGESYFHLVGLWSQVHDIPGWEWVGEIIHLMSEWRTYQSFPDPGRSSESGSISDSPYMNGPSGFSARTSGLALGGQQSVAWRDITAADLVESARPMHYNPDWGRSKFPEDEQGMIDAINRKIRDFEDEWGVTWEGTAPEWGGWSPWIKNMPYHPPSGWYERLDALRDANDPSQILPIDRPGYYYSKAFGGEPTGMEFWSFKGTDGNTDFGWYVEADPRQGTYGGWYGGKLEQFWTRDTGTVIINRHGKTGCDADDNEDSTCWNDIEIKGGHHVWGKDENRNAFTTLFIRGRSLERTATYQPESNPEKVEVVNLFNDPSLDPTLSRSGEETGSEIEGTFSVTNTFAALQNGIRVSHAISSDGTDEFRELWATIPVFLGDAQRNSGHPDTTIEYYDDGVWKALGERSQTTTQMRLGRDFLLGEGPQYVLITFDASRDVQLSDKEYEDPYQTNTRIRSVHIDLHGNPGSVQTLPEEIVVSYIITTGNEVSPVADMPTVSDDPTNRVTRYPDTLGEDRVLQIRAEDTIVYSTGYVSVDGNPWQPFELEGTTLSGNWLWNEGTIDLPIEYTQSSSNNWIAVYTCELVENQWECPDWQLERFNIV